MKNPLLLALLFLSLPVFGQYDIETDHDYAIRTQDSSSEKQRTLDSLVAFVQTYTLEDTIKVNALNELSRQHQWIDFYSSLAQADSALRLARKINYTKGIAAANNLKGF